MFGMSSLENNNNIYTGKILRELFAVLLKGSSFYCAFEALVAEISDCYLSHFGFWDHFSQ